MSFRQGLDAAAQEPDYHWDTIFGAGYPAPWDPLFWTPGGKHAPCEGESLCWRYRGPLGCYLSARGNAL